MPDSKQINLQIKGVREGLFVTLEDGDWLEVQESLLKHVQEQSSFFKGAKLALEVGNREIRAADMGMLRDKLGDLGVSLWAVIGSSPVTEKTAQMLGLATRLSTARPEREIHTMDTQMPGEDGLLVNRTLRSGYHISTPGHVTIIGDVNPGAEIVAGGSIIVWGKLRGMVHAGADGNENAVVCALDLAPTQLRIAGMIAVTPQRKGKPQPEIAHVQDGRVVAEVWDYKKQE
jgi:septum site-determining protein MinC